MFRLSRSVAIVALSIGALAVHTSPALAQSDSTTLRLPAADATLATSGFLVKGIATNNAEGQQSSSGQTRHEGIGFGVKGGFLWPSFAEAQGSGFEDKTGWLAGIFFGGNRPGTIGVMGEIQYGKKSGEAGNNTLDQYFLEIPILLRINAGTNSINGISFYGMAGPVFDINLNTKLNGVKIEDKYQSLDVGLLIAGGVEITRFIVEARYNQGFKNTLKSGGGGTSDLKSKSFALEVGLRFN